MEEAGFQAKLKVILEKLTAPRLGKTAKEARRFDDNQKTTINLREIFKTAIRCEICNGILDLAAGTQYDHTIQYAQSHLTDVNSGRPTHPFCNNQRLAIEKYQNGTERIPLPSATRNEFIAENETVQLSMFSLFAKTVFPGE